MNRDDLKGLLAKFSEGPIPATINRHIYLWIGELDELTSLGPPGIMSKLDLHSLCIGLSKTPYGDKAAGRELSEGIDTWLLEKLSSRQKQRALVIIGLDLLYRYRLPISTFVRLANENCMIIFALSASDINFRPAKPLPGYIHFSPDAILKYIGTGIPEDAFIREE